MKKSLLCPSPFVLLKEDCSVINQDENLASAKWGLIQDFFNALACFVPKTDRLVGCY